MIASFWFSTDDIRIVFPNENSFKIQYFVHYSASDCGQQIKHETTINIHDNAFVFLRDMEPITTDVWGARNEIKYFVI